MLKPSSTLADTLALGFRQNGFFVTVTRECSGLMPMLMYAAAVIAFPSLLKAKIIGLVYGFVILQITNVTRLISLAYVGQLYGEDTFNLVHERFWPVVFYIAIVLLFLQWLSRLERPATRTED